MCCGPDMDMGMGMGMVGMVGMDNPTGDEAAGDSGFVLLELAASDNLDGFKAAVDRDPSAVDLVGLWYSRRIGSKLMGLQQRTPLMVAATYGSLDVLRLIVNISGAPVDRCCGPEKTTALHCAASGGSANAIDAVKMLLSAGADLDAVDSDGRRPADVIAVPPEFSDSKIVLEGLLLGLGCPDDRRISVSPSGSSSPPLSPSSLSDSTPSPTTAKFPAPERKEYPVDPSMPDIKNSIYATDEFRMYSFKVRPCSRAYSHDWTECPFVHPGENARRRDPSKYNYCCVPCPDFRKGSCNRGDSCDYAHGVFESWLHPTQYRTRLCKDGTSCARRVCFFAHTSDELRGLYMPTGSAASSPRSLEMAMMSLLPVSPSAAVNTMSNSSLGCPQSNVPMLQIPSSNLQLQSSRLRSSINARDRDMLVDDLSFVMDLDGKQLEGTCFSPSLARHGYFGIGGNGNRPVRPNTLNNLNDLFAAEVYSSPRYSADHGALFSPSHKAALFNQHQHQQQRSLLPSINSGMFSPKPVDPLQHPLLQASLGISSPRRMSPRGIEQLSPFSSHLVAVAQQEKLQQHQLRSLSARDLISGTCRGISPTVGSPVNSSCPKWRSPTGKLDWGVNSEELERLKGASAFEFGSDGDDVSWIQPLVNTPEMEEKVVVTIPARPGTGAGVSSAGTLSNSNPLMGGNAMLGSMHLNQGSISEEPNTSEVARGDIE